MTITKSQYERIPSAWRWLVKALGVKVVPDPVKPPETPIPAPKPPDPTPAHPATETPQETPPAAPSEPTLVDGYKPTSGLPKARITCRAWGQSNDGQRQVTWNDDRHWPSRTASNGKVLNAILFVYIVRDGHQIASRRLDHVHTKNKSAGLGNMFFDPEDAYHAGNPFCDVNLRPRKGDQWAMCLTSQDGDERSTCTALTAWK